MYRIQNATVYSVLHLAGFHNRIHGQQVNAQRVAGHCMHAVHIGLRILKENAAASSRLHLQRGCRVLGNCGGGQCSGAYNGRPAQKFSAVQVLGRVSSQGILCGGPLKTEANISIVRGHRKHRHSMHTQKNGPHQRLFHLLPAQVETN